MSANPNSSASNLISAVGTAANVHSRGREILAAVQGAPVTDQEISQLQQALNNISATLKNVGTLSGDLSNTTIPKLNNTLDNVDGAVKSVNTTLVEVRSVVKDIKDLIPTLRIVLIMLAVVLGLCGLTLLVNLIFKLFVRKPNCVNAIIPAANANANTAAANSIPPVATDYTGGSIRGH